MAQMNTAPEDGRKSANGGIAYLLVAGIAIALGVWLWRSHASFDCRAFAQQFRAVSWGRVALGVACIYAGNWLRALRWSVLLAPVRKTPALHLSLIHIYRPRRGPRPGLRPAVLPQREQTEDPHYGP